MPKAAVAPSMRHRRPPHSPRQRSAPAACGSNTSIRAAPIAGLPDKWPSNRSSSNCPSSKKPNFCVKPRRVRISPSCAVMRSMTRPNRVFWANSRPCSVSRCTSTSGSPAASRFVFRSSAAVRRKCEIADLVRGLEIPTQQIAASLEMFRPWHDEISKAHIGPGLEALQAAFFDQFIAKPTESKSGLVVVEMWAGDHYQAIHRRSTNRRCCHARG